MTAEPESRMSSPDDAALAGAVRKGSTEALAALYRRHADDVYRTAYRVTGSEHEADDVLQDVFVGLRRALDRYEERGSFAAWLRAVTTRTALLHLRHRRRSAVRDVDVDTEQSSRPPDAALAEERIVARQALASLPDSLRVVFVLKEIAGYSHREIAELLGIGLGTSRVRLHRAWATLEQLVGDQP